jgi:hypothetical protein
VPFISLIKSIASFDPKLEPQVLPAPGDGMEWTYGNLEISQGPPKCGGFQLQVDRERVVPAISAGGPRNIKKGKVVVVELASALDRKATEATATLVDVLAPEVPLDEIKILFGLKDPKEAARH